MERCGGGQELGRGKKGYAGAPSIWVHRLRQHWLAISKKKNALKISLTVIIKKIPPKLIKSFMSIEQPLKDEQSFWTYRTPICAEYLDECFGWKRNFVVKISQAIVRVTWVQFELVWQKRHSKILVSLICWNSGYPKSVKNKSTWHVMAFWRLDFHQRDGEEIYGLDVALFASVTSLMTHMHEACTQHECMHCILCMYACMQLLQSVCILCAC